MTIFIFIFEIYRALEDSCGSRRFLEDRMMDYRIGSGGTLPVVMPITGTRETHGYNPGVPGQPNTPVLPKY